MARNTHNTRLHMYVCDCKYLCVCVCVYKKWGEKLENMKVNGPGRQKLEQGSNSWQWAEHVWLYSDLLQALKGEHLSALCSQQRGP